MNNLNSILIEGDTQQDPELKKTPQGIDICTFTIGVHRYDRDHGKTGHEVSYLEIEAWGKLALCAGRLKKGRGVRIVGRIKQYRWKDALGNENTKIRIVAEHIEIKPEYKR